ncbi:hypothetical protein M9458_015217, partial [Cirrhinus mrigala]
MTVGALRSRLLYVLSKKRLRVTSDAPHPGPPPAWTEAAVMGAEGDLGIAMEDNPPGKSSQTSHSPVRSVPPVEFPGGFDSSPQDGLDFSFGAPEGDEISVAASEGGLSDAEASTGLPPSGFCPRPSFARRPDTAWQHQDLGGRDFFAFPCPDASGRRSGRSLPQVSCRSRPMEQGKRSEELCLPLNRPCSTSLRAYCQGYPGYHPLGAARAESGGVVVASHSVTMAGQDDSARLCDSVRQASTQVQWCPFHFGPRRQRNCLAAGDCLLAKDAIEPVPPADMKKGFYSPYFIVPKKGGGLRPILDLRVLNRALHRLPFKILTVRHMFTCSAAGS